MYKNIICVVTPCVMLPIYDKTYTFRKGKKLYHQYMTNFTHLGKYKENCIESEVLSVSLSGLESIQSRKQEVCLCCSEWS